MNTLNILYPSSLFQVLELRYANPTVKKSDRCRNQSLNLPQTMSKYFTLSCLLKSHQYEVVLILGGYGVGHYIALALSVCMINCHVKKEGSMNSVRLLISTLALFLFLSASSFAATIPVDLNDFLPDPSTAVTISADGSTATMVEDQITDYPDVYLSNDPYFGGLGFMLPADATSLSFTLDFTKDSADDSTFLATLFDADFGPFSGFVADAYFDSSVAGEEVVWDLVGLDTSITYALEFQLNSWDYLFSSTATISNLAFEVPDQDTGGPAPVPEPGTFLLLGAGLAGLTIFRRKQNK